MSEAAAADGPEGVTGGLRVLLRLEGLALCAGAVLLYAFSGSSWLLFAALLLAPDLSFAGYLAGPRVGAACYNVVHTTIGADRPRRCRIDPGVAFGRRGRADLAGAYRRRPGARAMG